eukprot:366391-Chlamydomonas_euryale.AAC.15
MKYNYSSKHTRQEKICTAGALGIHKSRHLSGHFAVHAYTACKLMQRMKRNPQQEMASEKDTRYSKDTVLREALIFLVQMDQGLGGRFRGSQADATKYATWHGRLVACKGRKKHAHTALVHVKSRHYLSVNRHGWGKSMARRKHGEGSRMESETDIFIQDK